MKTVQLKFDDEVHRKAKTAAFRVGLTLAEFIRRAVEDKVEKCEPTEPCPASAWRVQ